MSRRHFGSTENAELRAKIDEAKRRLPLMKLMSQLGLGERAKKEARCPFHDDEHPSFSAFQKNSGEWRYKCFACDTQGGDEIAFLVKHFGISRREAIRRYLEMAGFPTRRRESHEYPESPVCPVSEGQAVDGEMDKRLKAFAAQSACTQLNTARTRRLKLLRDLKVVEKEIRRKLQVAELAIAFDEWHRLSLPFLDPAKAREHYEAKFLSEYPKVRFATGEGTLATALENVAKLPPDQLPIIPAKPNAPDSWRRLAALHCELARLTVDGYFVSYRDAAKVFDGLSHQEAYEITGALVTLGVIAFVHKGQPGLISRKAAEFRYLMSQTENRGEEDDAGFEL